MTAALDDFLQRVRSIDDPCVLEVGTRRSDPARPTHHRDWVPHALEYVMLDVTEGLDVDMVADLHSLPLPTDTYDVIIASSVFEHLERPWIAAREVVRVMRPGGAAYIQTHQSFPLHGYPNDFFRFSIEALFVIFRDAGAGECIASYAYPAKIVPDEPVPTWNDEAAVWLNVDISITKGEES